MAAHRRTITPDAGTVALMRGEIDDRALGEDALFIALDDFERNELAEMVAATGGQPCPHLVRVLEHARDMGTGQPGG
jgi:hypothetical protein